MENEIFEHSISFCWVFIAGKMPASNILYRILWVQNVISKPIELMSPIQPISRKLFKKVPSQFCPCSVVGNSPIRLQFFAVFD
jgi:hypothetical protein